MNKISTYFKNTAASYTGLSDANNSDARKSASAEIDNNDLIVSLNELLIPLSLSLALSFIHSQIVATAANKLASDSRKHSSGSIVHPKRKKRERKRRKKCIKGRSSITGLTAPQSSDIRNLQQIHKSSEPEFDFECSDTQSHILETKIATDDSVVPKAKTTILKSSLNSNVNCLTFELKKRNVNWESPIKSHHPNRTVEKATASSRNENLNPNYSPDDFNPLLQNELNHEGNENIVVDQIAADDDGFESLNGKSSSGEENLNAAVATSNLVKSNEENGLWSARSSFDQNIELVESDIDQGGDSLVCIIDEQSPTK